MRAIVTLDKDTAAGVEHLQRERGIGISAAVNELVRAGLTTRPDIQPFVQRATPSPVRPAGPEKRTPDVPPR